MTECVRNERIAQMKDSLLTEPKAADRCRLVSLRASCEGEYAFLISVPELSIIHHE